MFSNIFNNNCQVKSKSLDNNIYKTNVKKNLVVWTTTNLIKWGLMLLVIEGIIATGIVLGIPSDPQNALFLGLSPNRIFYFVLFALVDLLLLWLMLHFFRGSTVKDRIVSSMEAIINRDKVFWGMIIGLVVSLALCLFIISQWGLLASDQQIRAYLIRLNPFLLMCLFGSTQSLVVLMLISRRGSEGWLSFSKIMSAGYGLLFCLFIAEYYLLDFCVPRFFIKETYEEAFINFVPIALSQIVLVVQWILFAGNRFSSKRTWIFYLFLLICTGIFFYKGAAQHAQEVNIDIERSDQRGFVRFTRQVSKSGYTYMGNRNQTPGYPYIQAVFCGNQIDESATFSCGKIVNIWLSIFLLGVISWIGYKDLGLESAICFTFVTAFSLFIFKAGYYKVDLVYYFSSFISFYLMIRMLNSPAIGLGLITGMVLGLVQLLKASALPGVVIFVLVFLGKILYSMVVNRKLKVHDWSCSSWKMMVGLVLLVFGFLVIQIPYLLENKQQYGSYFYNFNSEVYIWYDSFDEASLARGYYDVHGTWPGYLEDSTPGLVSYLERHTFSEVLARFGNGLLVQAHYIIGSYNQINYLILYAIVMVLLILTIDWRKIGFVKPYSAVIVFICLYSGAHFSLYSWYTPIGSGPRFVNSLFLPILWVIISAIHLISRHEVIKVLKWHVSAEKFITWVHRVVIALLTYDAVVVLTQILPQGYFGS